MQKNKTITNTLTDEREYRRILEFCTEHGLYCFEYHYRWKIRLHSTMKLSQKMESIKNDFSENRITDSSRMEKELAIRERKEYLYGLVEENAELRGISVNSFLHVIYGEIERVFDVALNSYRAVYRSEMGKPDAGMVEAVAANDRFYDLAVKLCEFMIKDYKEQAALAEGMKNFKG